jgi:hypothetical protein
MLSHPTHLHVPASQPLDPSRGDSKGAEALEAIEVAGTPVKAFAEQKGLSSNNAGVRVFRAREALKKRAEFLVQPSFSSPSARMLTRSGQPQRDCRT